MKWRDKLLSYNLCCVTHCMDREGYVVQAGGSIYQRTFYRIGLPRKTIPSMYQPRPTSTTTYIGTNMVGEGQGMVNLSLKKANPPAVPTHTS
jgi:hypothetical protein